MAVWHPRSAHQTECWRWFFVDRDAPTEVKHFLRDYYIRYSGPAGMTEQDDMENWNYAHAASRGTIARRYPYNYDQGSGTAVSDYEYQLLSPVGRVHGGRRLVAARDLARRRAQGSRMRLAE
jgi:hypothetical protein